MLSSVVSLVVFPCQTIFFFYPSYCVWEETMSWGRGVMNNAREFFSFWAHVLSRQVKIKLLFFGRWVSSTQHQTNELWWVYSGLRHAAFSPQRHVSFNMLILGAAKLSSALLKTFWWKKWSHPLRARAQLEHCVCPWGVFLKI